MSMPKHPRRLFGFTLLELLVVISIIGILVAMGVASFSVAQQQGRDARRRADMKSFQNCMEQASASSAPSSYVYTHVMSNACIATLKDPKTNAAYMADNTMVHTTGERYCAAALLDNDTKGNCGGCSGNSPVAGDTTHFCVSSLQ